MATLLTGAGYIGAALLDRLTETAGRDDEPVVVLDNWYSTPRDAFLAAVPPGVKIIDGDVAETADVARAFDALSTTAPVTVFHLAAQPSAAMAVREPGLTEHSNLVGARVLLEAATERQATVIFGGSFRVYGDDLAGLCVDETTPYGRVGDLSHLSKIYVEQLARMLGVRFASVRLGVTYGLSPIMKTTPAFMTVPNLFCQRAAQGEVLRVLEDRPMAFIHVEDAADALLGAAHLTSNSTWQVVNAAPEVASIGRVARTVERLVQQRGKHARIEGAAATSGATFQVSSRLALQPRHTLESGLVDVLDYFLARR
ncbi:MAG: NAD(P)-dependent oxidoreductase [Chloroflexi bacterium]|nr:NAD(P)-dependent oxidoreductase [Chloroflexota bacterium]